MRKKLLSILVLSILAASTLVGCGQPGQSGESCMLTIFSTSGGNVSVMKAGTGNWIAAQVGMCLEPEDIIKSGNSSNAEITCLDGSTIEIQAGTKIEVVLATTENSSTTIVLNQTIGSIIFRVIKIIDPASRYEVQTPTGEAVVRGSAMLVRVIEDGTTWVTNLEGDIWAVAQGVELQIPQGQQCIISPGQPPESVMVAAGGYHTVGLNSNGTVVAVGNNTYGQRNVGNWTDITQVAAGYLHTVGLNSNGTVVAVGENTYGERNVGNWTEIVQVAAGYHHTVGLFHNGTVVAVGNNDYGQRNVGNWTGITQVSAGGYHTVGLNSNGTVVAVGDNSSGRCDVGNWTNITQVSAGGLHTVGLNSNGTVVAVGFNIFGQCNVTGWTGIIQISAGCCHTVGLKSDGTVVAVGHNTFGQCNIGGWTNIIQVAAGECHTVGLKSDGTVVAVGDNAYGQCNVTGWDLN